MENIPHNKLSYRNIQFNKIYIQKIFLSISLVSLFIGCSDKNKTETNIKVPVLEKTAIELEDESIKKGGSTDTTSLDFVLGMTKKQVVEHCKELKSKNIIDYLTDGTFYYAIETKNFKIPLRVFLYYDNEEKLFRMKEEVIVNLLEKKKKSSPNADFKKELLQNYKDDLGKTPLKNGTQANTKFYWLKGDKRFDYLESENNSALATTKISSERKIIAYNDEVERIKQEQERKKQEEEILQKENLANLQIQEEANIIAKLKVKAKRNWPDDYTTQEFWINQQIEAYHNMLTIPDTDRIKKKAQRDWPLDFTTQQFWYNEQIGRAHV